MKPIFTSFRQDWRTPKDIYEKLHSEFSFTFDPCPPNPDFNGLAVEWGSSNFCNPPYNKLIHWVAKGFQEHKKGKTVVFLIPSRTDTIWWHDYCMNSSEIRFLKGRLSFDDDGGRATFPSSIVIFQTNQESPMSGDK